MAHILEGEGRGGGGGIPIRKEGGESKNRPLASEGDRGGGGREAAGILKEARRRGGFASALKSVNYALCLNSSIHETGARARGSLLKRIGEGETNGRNYRRRRLRRECVRKRRSRGNGGKRKQ